MAEWKRQASVQIFKNTHCITVISLYSLYVLERGTVGISYSSISQGLATSRSYRISTVLFDRGSRSSVPRRAFHIEEFKIVQCTTNRALAILGMSDEDSASDGDWDADQEFQSITAPGVRFGTEPTADPFDFTRVGAYH